MFTRSRIQMPSEATELAHEPSLGELPIAHHALRRDLQHLGGLLHAQAAEEAQLDDFGLARIEKERLAKFGPAKITNGLDQKNAGRPVQPGLGPAFDSPSDEYEPED